MSSLPFKGFATYDDLCQKKKKRRQKHGDFVGDETIRSTRIIWLYFILYVPKKKESQGSKMLYLYSKGICKRLFIPLFPGNVEGTVVFMRIDHIPGDIPSHHLIIHTPLVALLYSHWLKCRQTAFRPFLL